MNVTYKNHIQYKKYSIKLTIKSYKFKILKSESFQTKVSVLV